MVTDSLEGTIAIKAQTLSGSRKFDRALKHVIDSLGSSVLLLCLSPLFLFIAVLILLLDGRPLIYRRRVVGGRGEFDAYKFRTMVRDADNVLAANPELNHAFSKQFKLREDPRITPLGSWLRKYSLDELPQLVNVLKGQMSLVGPRMITTVELVKYGPHENLLLTVRPGITGYWQVSGRQDLSYEERVNMDIKYITNWSLLLDAKILFRTPLKVVRGEGAY